MRHRCCVRPNWNWNWNWKMMDITDYDGGGGMKRSETPRGLGRGGREGRRADVHCVNDEWGEVIKKRWMGRERDAG